VTTKLAHQTQKTAGIPNGMRTATIAAVTSSSVTITVSGGDFTAGVGVVTSYVPVVGDTVAVFRQDSSWLILGRTTVSPYGNWVRFSDLGYLNGWSDRNPGSQPIGQYRIVGDSVQVTGEITNAAISNNTVVSGLPAPIGECVIVGAGQTNSFAKLAITAAGNLVVGNMTVAGFIQFCGTYPLDPLMT
jgi:hypothetical protein